MITNKTKHQLTLTPTNQNQNFQARSSDTTYNTYEYSIAGLAWTLTWRMSTEPPEYS